MFALRLGGRVAVHIEDLHFAALTGYASHELDGLLAARTPRRSQLFSLTCRLSSLCPIRADCTLQRCCEECFGRCALHSSALIAVQAATSTRGLLLSPNIFAVQEDGRRSPIAQVRGCVPCRRVNLFDPASDFHRGHSPFERGSSCGCIWASLRRDQLNAQVHNYPRVSAERLGPVLLRGHRAIS